MVREQEQQLKTFSASKKEKEVVLERLKKTSRNISRSFAVQKKRRQLQSRIESLILAEQQAVEAEKERQRRKLEARRLEARRKEAQRLEDKKRGAATRITAFRDGAIVREERKICRSFAGETRETKNRKCFQEVRKSRVFHAARGMFP